MSVPAEPLPTLVPGYATVATRGGGVSVGLYRTAVACAAAPLLVGCAILFLYWLVRADAVAFAGLLTILVGLVVAGVAALLLAIVTWQAWRQGRPTFRAWRRRLGLAALLLLVNFPAAILCAGIGQRLMSTGYLTITNRGATRVDSFVVTWPTGSKDFGPIEPGATVKGSFVVSSDGKVTFRQRHGATVSDGTLEGYTTSMQGSELTVVTSETAVLVNGSPADPIDPDN